MRSSTPPRATPSMGSSFLHRSARAAWSRWTRVMRGARPGSGWWSPRAMRRRSTRSVRSTCPTASRARCLRSAGPPAVRPGRIGGRDPASSSIGDFETAFANAPVKVDATYTTPYQHQAPMEPHATMAMWDGPRLTVYTAAQLTGSPQAGLARTFNMRQEDVRVITRYIGGGFGSKLPYYVDATLAAIGARMVRRPVKVAMTRPQLFHMTTHRTASEQRLRLGAG